MPAMPAGGTALTSEATRSRVAAARSPALAVGNVKYRTEAGLFRRLLAAGEPLALDFRDAYRR
jgi:hypothetical protein